MFIEEEDMAVSIPIAINLDSSVENSCYLNT